MTCEHHTFGDFIWAHPKEVAVLITYTVTACCVTAVAVAESFSQLIRKKG